MEPKRGLSRSSSSLRKQGPITTGRADFYQPLAILSFPKQPSRSMGPCFRRDDKWAAWLRSVVRLLAVEDALQCIEVPLCRGWALVEAGPADIPLGLLDHGGGELFQGLSRPHRVELNLCRAFDIVKPIVGIGDGLADRADAVVGHDQHGLAAAHPAEPSPRGGSHGAQGVDAPLLEIVDEGQPARRPQIDPRPPLLGAVIPKRFRRNPELHRYPPGLSASRRRLDGFIPGIVA